MVKKKVDQMAFWTYSAYKNNFSENIFLVEQK